MRNNLPKLPAIAGIVAALVTASCTYDPYYSTSGYYSSGYGYGHGYGGSSFSTSLFVSTGDSRWGYDPYNYCYYDYRSRRYYDPYLYGYYPVGYRPPVLVGVPHPHGWRPGRGYCPPPKVVRNVTVVNYRDRAACYRKSDHSWARDVRIKDSPRGHDGQHGSRDSQRRDSGAASIWNRDRFYSGGRREGNDADRDSRSSRSGRSDDRGARVPSGYQTPVTRREAVQPRDSRKSGPSRTFEPTSRRPEPSPRAAHREVREAAPAQFRGRGGPQPQSRPQPQPRQEPPRENGRESRRGLRGLGDA